MTRLTFDTSGTTGEPKQVPHTWKAMWANAKAFNEAAGLGVHTRMYHCLPMEHMAGVLNTIMCPAAAGGTLVEGPPFSAQTAASFWPVLFYEEANTVWITPTIAAMLLRIDRRSDRARQTQASNLNHVFCGTAPLPLTIRQQWLETYGIPLQESYGTSEHMLVSVQSKEDALTEHNVGKPIPGAVVEIGDNSEILVNGTGTGDQGELRNGKLTITGRLKDLIIRGGFNISPLKVEEAVRQVCRDAAVVGQPDEFWGERIVVFAERGDKATIADHCHVHLPKSHWPDVIEIVDKLPRNEMGKVRKEDLKSMFVA